MLARANIEARYVQFLVLLGAVFTLIALTQGCKAAGGGPTGSGVVVASVAIDSTTDPLAKPTSLVRYDGNTLVAWGDAQINAEVFLAGSGIPLFGPTLKSKDIVIVRVREPKFVWDGSVAEPLPQEAAILFRAGEIAAWGLTFVTPAPAP